MVGRQCGGALFEGRRANFSRARFGMVHADAAEIYKVGVVSHGPAVWLGASGVVWCTISNGRIPVVGG